MRRVLEFILVVSLVPILILGIPVAYIGMACRLLCHDLMSGWNYKFYEEK